MTHTIHLTNKMSPRGRHKPMRCMSQYALAATLLLCFAMHGTAQAYDLSRGFDENSGDTSAEERVFIDGQLGLWLPGPVAFNRNHTTSAAFGAEVGVKVFDLKRHRIYVVGGMTLSPQALEPHLSQTSTTMVQGFGGVRYSPSASCLPNDAGCGFAQVSLGLTWDTVDNEPGHGAPKGALTANFGLGYRFHLGELAHVGVRLDLGYLEESATRQIGWLIPSAFGGVRF